MQPSANMNPRAEVQKSAPMHNAQATSTTLGVVGSFDLSERWSVISALTVSQLNSDDRAYGYSTVNKRNMAVIGTTYAF